MTNHRNVFVCEKQVKFFCPTDDTKSLDYWINHPEMIIFPTAFSSLVQKLYWFLFLLLRGFWFLRFLRKLTRV